MRERESVRERERVREKEKESDNTVMVGTNSLSVNFNCTSL